MQEKNVNNNDINDSIEINNNINDTYLEESHTNFSYKNNNNKNKSNINYNNNNTSGYVEVPISSLNIENNGTTTNNVDSYNTSYFEFIQIDNSNQDLSKTQLFVIKYINSFLLYLKKHQTITTSVLFSIAVILYLYSLRGCPTHFLMMQCLAKFGQKDVYELISYLNYASFCFSVLILLVYKYYITDRKIIIVMTIILSYILFFYDTGMDLYSHGGYNSKFFILLSFIYVFVNSLLILLLKKLILKFKVTLTIICLIIFAIVYSYNSITKSSCNYWNKGFKDTFINNEEKDSCAIANPEICWFKVFDGIFDFPKLTNQQCSADKTFYDNDLLLKNINLHKYYSSELNVNQYSKTSKALYLGFPRTEKYDLIKDTDIKKFQKNILNNMIDMSFSLNKKVNTSETKFNDIDNDKYFTRPEDVEFTIDFRNSTSDNPSFIAKLELKKNTTLETERNELRNKEKSMKNANTASNNKNDHIDYSDLVDNVLVIFIDSLSRAHIRRKLPNLVKYFEKYYNDPSKEFSSYQFLKFQSLYPGTVANIAAGFYGAFPGSKKGYDIRKKYKEKGFVTLNTYNFCQREFMDIEKELNFTYSNPDHDFVSVFCDPSYTDLENPYKMFSGPYGMAKKCLWGKQTIEWQVDYIKQFFDSYSNSSKFLTVALEDSHEGSGEVIKYAEESLLELFSFLETKHYLGNTMVVLFSDHGFFMPGSIYQLLNLNDFHHEQTLPSMFYLLPRNIKNFEEIDRILKANEQKMITTFDLYQTLSAISGGNYKNTKVGENLLEKTKSGSVSNCESLKIRDEFCRCRRVN